MKYSLSLIFLFFFCVISAGAQTTASAPAATAVTLTLRPIDSRLSTLDGLTYTQNGDELNSYEDLRAVISPLKDYEADRLLNRSQATDDLGRILRVVGLLGAVGSVVGLAADNNSSDQTNFLFGLIGSELSFDAGLLFGAEAQSTKFNAVQRYNRFAYGREQILPQAPVDEKSLLPVTAPAAVPTAAPVATMAPTVTTNGTK